MSSCTSSLGEFRSGESRDLPVPAIFSKAGVAGRAAKKWNSQAWHARFVTLFAPPQLSDQPLVKLC